MSLLLEFSMFPTGKEQGLSEYVARLVKLVQDSGLPYKLGAMGTTIEGESDQVFQLVQRCLAELQKDTRRVTAYMHLDWRAGRENGLEGKVRSVQQRLRRPVQT